MGITSGRYAAAHLMAATANVALISLRVNDGPPSMTKAENLVHLRAASNPVALTGFSRPVPDATRALIADVAHTFGNQLIETWGFTRQDGLYLPASSYRAIASVFNLPMSP